MSAEFQVQNLFDLRVTEEVAHRPVQDLALVQPNEVPEPVLFDISSELLEVVAGVVALFPEVIPTVTIRHAQLILCLPLSDPQLTRLQSRPDQSGPPYRMV